MRPNILVFMTDQQRGDTMLPEGPARMPNLQRLIRQGVVFPKAYCPSPHCCPSRASFFSGLYPSQHGVWNNVDLADAHSKGLYDGVKLFSEDLREAGYQMYFSGKWHVSAAENPADRGFEELYLKARQTGEKAEQRNKPDMRDWEWFRQKCYQTGKEKRKDGEIQREGFPQYIQYGEAENPFGDEAVIEHAVMQLKKMKENEPFFMYVGTLGPHDPYYVPKKYLDWYPIDSIVLPENFGDAMEDKPHLYQRTRKRFSQLSTEEQKRSLQHYLAFCSYEDALFGRILDTLEEQKLLESTIVIYLSDHGDYGGAHGLWTKGLPCFQEAYHICSAVGFGGVKAKGRRVEEMISLVDYAPTFLDLAGIKPDRTFAGQSLVPFLNGNTPAHWRKELYTQSNGNELYGIQRAVFNERFKFVYNGFDFDELYDLQRDPLERYNLANQPEYAGVVKDLYKKIWDFAYRNEDMLGDSYITTALCDYGPGILDELNQLCEWEDKPSI